jgi:L-histidine N-alpha-methyltransferase
MIEALTPEQLDIINGLVQTPATISPKYFYDAKGSVLFEAITRLAEYYPTRTEQAIMSAHAPAIARAIGTQCTVIELGAGNCQKARSLCELIQPLAYLAVDISEAFLQQAVAGMREAFPSLAIHVLAVDLTADITLPTSLPTQRRLVFYPGSSIGNFDPPHALALLSRMRGFLNEEGALLIGVDLVKDAAVLNAAYDDATGITAAFNLNVLEHLNHLVGSDFDVRQWQHRAFFNDAQSRIEMHLEAMVDVVVRWPGAMRSFARGERIHTENSYKYRVEEFVNLLRCAGLPHAKVWTDERAWFAVVLARP